MTTIICPNCGHHFNRPLATERKLGWGLSALLLALYKSLHAKLGSIKCPACGRKARGEASKKIGFPWYLQTDRWNSKLHQCRAVKFRIILRNLLKTRNLIENDVACFSNEVENSILWSRSDEQSPMEREKRWKSSLAYFCHSTGVRGSQFFVIMKSVRKLQ